jgi:hypothetical protein
MLVAPAGAGAATAPTASRPPLRVTAAADASVAAAHPHRLDRSATLRVGGRDGWRVLLRFDVRGDGPVSRATLGVWALGPPPGPIIARTVRTRRRWPDRRLTFARAPRLGPVTGTALPPPRACPRAGTGARACRSRGRWMWIDVTRAVRSKRRVALALTARTRKALRISSRADRRHAPRLLVQHAAPGAAPAPAPAATSAPAASSSSPAPTPLAQAPAAASPSTPCTGVAPSAAWHHVVWIWMENKDYSQVVGAPGGPYVSSLAGRCGLATNYHAITHPSLPNYIAATSGGTQGVTDDASPSAHPLTAPSIFEQTGAGWRGLNESMPANCALNSSGPYAVRHNPAAYYTPARTACQQQNVPLTGPAIDAAFTFITPNLCNDTHGCPVATGDAWLQQFVPQLISTPPYQAGDTLVVMTWDENDGSATNHIPTLMLAAPSVTPGTQDATAYTHYSLLRTTEEPLGLPALGSAASAPSMRAGFGLG